MRSKWTILEGAEVLARHVGDHDTNSYLLDFSREFSPNEPYSHFNLHGQHRDARLNYYLHPHFVRRLCDARTGAVWVVHSAVGNAQRVFEDEGTRRGGRLLEDYCFCGYGGSRLDVQLLAVY